MATLLNPSAYRLVGLSIAAGYTGFGLFATCLPHHAASQFFAIAPQQDIATDSSPKETQTQTQTQRETDSSKNEVKTVSDAVALLLPLLGARDLTIAASLWALAYAGKWQEFGTVVVSGTILCVADTVAIWRFRGRRT